MKIGFTLITTSSLVFFPQPHEKNKLMSTELERKWSRLHISCTNGRCVGRRTENFSYGYILLNIYSLNASWWFNGDRGNWNHEPWNFKMKFILFSLICSVTDAARCLDNGRRVSGWIIILYKGALKWDETENQSVSHYSSFTVFIMKFLKPWIHLAFDSVILDIL